MKPLCVQVNWQRQFGGGEIYTRFFTQALQALGWEVQLVVDRKASFWKTWGSTGWASFPSDREATSLLPCRANPPSW